MNLVPAGIVTSWFAWKGNESGNMITSEGLSGSCFLI